MLKYLEIDSTYRNRKEFPNPTNFELITAHSGTKSLSTNSISPISIATPIITYTPSDINNIIATSVQINNANSPTSFIVCFPIAQNASKIADYYRGTQAEVEITVGTSVSSLGNITIQSWDYLNTGIDDCFRVTFFPAIDQTLFPNITRIQFFCSTDFSLGNVFIPSGIASSQTYKNFLLYNETLNQYETILTYDGTISLAHISPFTGWSLNHVISLRKEIPRDYGQFQAGSTRSLVVLANTTSPDKNSIVGSYLRITQPGSNFGQIVQINSYEGSPTFIATLSNLLNIPPSIGDNYELLSFTEDGYVPLNYSGTHTTQDTCYEVQLVNLIIPNIGIFQGGVLASYPYLYVEFQNYTTSSGGTTNLIYSNNPNACKKLFRVPVTDISPSSVNSFLTLDKCYMAQKVRINPYNSFKFGIYLPSGVPLEFSIQDSDPPNEPNKSVQVSALFSLRKIN